MMRALSVVAFVLFLYTPFVYAQITAPLPLTGFERQLSFVFTPSYPEPHQSVRLSLETYGLDLSRSTIIWYVNEEEVARGIGETNITLTTGALGEETHVLVTAESTEGIVASAETLIRPTEVDILWEADSYVPPFYKGRPLPGANSSIRAHAIVRFQDSEGAIVPDSEIIYTWYRNNTIVEQGRGRSSVVIRGPELFGAETTRVVAESYDKAFVGEAQESIAATDPFVMLYENHPLFGILYHRALEGSVDTLENEQKITAAPYFADILSAQEDPLIYEWSVNGDIIIADPIEPQTLTITAGGYTGPVNIALSLTSLADILLDAREDIQLVFGERGSSFFSNLNPFGSGE